MLIDLWKKKMLSLAQQAKPIERKHVRDFIFEFKKNIGVRYSPSLNLSLSNLGRTFERLLLTLNP